jgi:mycothiol synthase
LPDHRAVLAALERLEDPRDGAAAPVDEDEHRRLRGAIPVWNRSWSWEPRLIERDGLDLAYVGSRSAPPGADEPVARRLDVTLRRSPGSQAAAAVLLREILEGAQDEDAASVTEVWLRGAEASELATASEFGLAPLRTLHVLRADSTDRSVVERAPLPAGVTVRPSRESDVDALARLLGEVYPGGARAWDAEGLRIRRSSPWFRDEDVLLAIDEDGALAAVHWMKRRDAMTGEVHNLAVHPQRQGIGLGAAMLDLGLAHLHDVGRREVLLWVDAANEAALAVYASRGFVHEWDDVVLSRRPS